jgi:rsbT co-antagonist protein RsbR
MYVQHQKRAIMTVHLEPPPTTSDNLAALCQRNADLERQLAECQTARQSLQEQVDIFCQSMDLLDEMVIIKGPKSRIVYGNKAFRDLYGMSLEQLHGMIDAPFNEPDYTQQYIRDDEQVFTTGQPLEIPIEHVVRHDGALRHVHTLKAPAYNSAGQISHTVAVIRDITDHMQAQTELQIYAEVVNGIQHGIVVWRLEQLDDPNSLVAVAGNPAAARIAGVDLREHIGKKFIDILPDLKATGLPEIYAEVIRSGQSRNLGEISFTSGNQPFLFTIEAFPLPNQCIAVTFENVTERKRAEEALRQSMLQEEKIRAQQVALEELSTPMIPITDRIVVMPLIGAIDSRRAQQVMDSLLYGVANTRAETAIIDITGVSVVDTQVANALVRAAVSVQLLGARVMITGIRPEVAQTLVGLGVDLRGISAHGTLSSAISVAMAKR